MVKRPNLQTKLEEILGSRNAYFQPPTSLKMDYPAIVYSLSNIENNFANDNVYTQSNFYELTVIDYDPESEVMVKVSQLPGIKFERHYVVNNLNHWKFVIY